MKKSILYSLASLLLVFAASCVREDIVEEPESVKIYAKIEGQHATKTTLSGLENGKYYPLWTEQDEIAVFVDGNDSPAKFVLDSGEGTRSASFTGDAKGNSWVALYPYQSTTSLSSDKVTFTFPENQTYVPGSFAQGAFPMLAVGNKGDSLNFINLAAVMKLSLTGNASVRSIKVTSNNTLAYMSGPASVPVNYSPDDDADPLSMQSGNSRSVTLNCHGVQLSEIPTYFHIVIPAQQYRNGFKVEIDTYSEVITKSINTEVIFKRSELREVTEINISTDADESRLAKEKAALIKIYDALGGDDWYDIWNGDLNTSFKNNRWDLKFDEPVDTWYGVTTDSEGFVTELRLPGMNLKGELPLALFELTGLKILQLNNNLLSGNLPQEIGLLTHLKELYLDNNKLSGEIPGSIGNLTDLEYLFLNSNEFTGTFPVELTYLNNLTRIQLCDNALSGHVPFEFVNWPAWQIHWGMMLMGNDFKFDDLYIYVPYFEAVGLDGSKINSAYVCWEHEYTIFLQWDVSDANTPTLETESITAQLKKIYEDFSIDAGIIAWANSNTMSKNIAERFVENNDIPWPNFYYDYANGLNTIGSIPWYPTNFTTSVTVVYPDGRVVFSDVFADKDKLYAKGSNYLYDLIKNDFKPRDESLYYSSDYSADGTVVTLQTATAGNGIDMVLMGDAYSDRDIESGLYRSDMEFMYQNLFTEEPYKSYKNLFNVYYVNVVSANEGYSLTGRTALDCGFGEGTLVWGDDDKCFRYAQKAISSERVDEALIIVSMNSNAYAGTCYMYYPSYQNGTYGSGPAVAYFPKGNDAAVYAQLLQHEANGHGFAKLADEYAYEDMGGIPRETEEETRNQQNEWGWWKNVDFTSDTQAVRWAKFINEPRYASEYLGCYEGGLTYWTGVWRPTDNSIMRYNTGGFNAPSREAIYYRIHKLAYGDSWEYDYQQFVNDDASGRMNFSTYASEQGNYVEKVLEPTAPPVVVAKPWTSASKQNL